MSSSSSQPRQNMDYDLESLPPEEAVDMYLAQRKPEVSQKTLQNQRYRLSRFLEWCEEAGLEDMNDLSGRDIHRYRTARSKDVAPVTLRGELQTFRVFLEFCATVDAVPPGMREQVLLPEVDPEDEANDEQLVAERAHEILDSLERFRYASREHVIMSLLWHTGIRLGTLRAIDVDDVDTEERYIHVQHRPDTGTPLKNGQAAERYLSVSERYAQVLQDYIDINRRDVVDDYGRAPLITSREGRYSEHSVRATVYRMTQPCEFGSCPHEKDPETCEWRHRDKLAQCPSSRSPHGIRRGAITYMLREDTPQRVVQDRANVSEDIVEQHYDQRTDREKMESRRDFVEGLE